MTKQLSLDTHEYFYVYILGRPDGSVFYVGKGCKDRVGQHEREAQRGCKCDKCEIIRNIWRVGGEVVKKIVYQTSDGQDALVHEGQLIQRFREQLVNKKGGRRRAKYGHPLIDGMPTALRIARKRTTKGERTTEERAVRIQLRARLNVLHSRLSGAIQRNRQDLIQRIEGEIAALELLINPPVQLELEGL